MAKHYKSSVNSPILYYSKKSNLSKTDLCRMLDITGVTLNAWISNPRNMMLKDICLMAGLFTIPVERLTLLLIRNKARLKKDNKDYLDSVLLSREIE